MLNQGVKYVRYGSGSSNKERTNDGYHDSPRCYRISVALGPMGKQIRNGRPLFSLWRWRKKECLDGLSLRRAYEQQRLHKYLARSLPVGGYITRQMSRGRRACDAMSGRDDRERHWCGNSDARSIAMLLCCCFCVQR